MSPKVLAAVVAALVGSVCASLFGLGLIVRPAPQQPENGTAAPPVLVNRITESPKRTAVVDDEWDALSMVGGFVFPGTDVDVGRVILLANGDTQMDVVLNRVRVRERAREGYPDGYSLHP